MNIKKSISVFLLSAMLLVSINLPAIAQEVTVKIDDEKLNCTVSPRIDNGTTMVPMRAVFEALGMSVSWDDETKTITATDDKNTIKLTVGKKELIMEDKVIELPVAPYIDSNTTLVPVRAISESVDATVVWDDNKKQVEITTAEYELKKEAWKDNEGTIDLTTLTVTGLGINVTDNVIYITEGGDFTVTGENDNAMIHVNTKYKVKLRLSGVELTNPTGPAIFFENSDKALITISKETDNYISDGAEYSVDAKAAVFSNDDIEIKGEGKLTVVSLAHHAIASDDDIKIEEGTMVLKAEAKDGIHANNEIKILGGKIEITAEGDGIQAEENIIIENGEISVTTTGEVVNSQNSWGNRGGFGGDRNWRDNRIQPDAERPLGEGMTPPENMPERPEGMMPESIGRFPQNMMPPEGMAPPETMGNIPQPSENLVDEIDAEDEATATKGIKAETDITISGGKITVNASDHAIHSAGAINIKDGEMVLESAHGKGISAHGDVVIDGGRITVTKASEALESKANFTINGGEIVATGSDDGINAGGTGGRDVASRQNSNQATGHDLVINGGTIFVNAAGDGLDANGRMIINGGNIIVEGPTNNGNGALDSGGVILVNGGTLIALGASGMAENPGNESLQPSFRLVTEENLPSGTPITITNQAGDTIYSYTTVKTGNSIVFSSDKLKIGEAYIVKYGDKEQSITLTDMVTAIGNGGWGGFGGGRGWR